MPSAGQRTRAVDFPTAVTDIQTAVGTVTSTTYTATLAGGGTACGQSFLAPTSGRVAVAIAARMSNNGVNATYTSFVVREGSSIGSGTTFLAASDARAVQAQATVSDRKGVVEMVTGLTPGNPYNVQQAFRVVGGTGTYDNKSLNVFPLP